jgi:hypothetical protein
LPGPHSRSASGLLPLRCQLVLLLMVAFTVNPLPIMVLMIRLCSRSMLLSVRFHCCCNLFSAAQLRTQPGMVGYAAAIALLRVSNDAKMAAFTMKPLPMVAPRPLASTPRPSSRMLLAAHCHAL